MIPWASRSKEWGGDARQQGDSDFSLILGRVILCFEYLELQKGLDTDTSVLTMQETKQTRSERKLASTHASILFSTKTVTSRKHVGGDGMRS